jgi:hypothetical protein
MGVLPENTVLGTLELLEVFQYYDGPKLFSAYNRAGSIFLVFWLGDEIENGPLNRWLYIPVSKTRLDNVKAGNISLLAACETAEDGIAWVVAIPYSKQREDSAQPIVVADIAEEDLPLADSSLRIPTHTITSIEPILLHALRSQTDVLDLSLAELESQRSEVGIKGFGSTLISVQNCIDSLYAAARGYRTRRIPDKIIERSKLQAVDTFPSSFGVRLEGRAADTNLFSENDLYSTFEYFIRLVRLGNQPELLIEELKKLNSNVAVRYLGLFEALAKSRISFKAVWGRPVRDTQTNEAQVSWEQASTAFDALRQSIEEYVEILTVDCLLEAIDVRKGTFGLTDIETGLHYEGKIGHELISDATRASARVPAKYLASIQQNQRMRPYSDLWEPFYTLLGLQEKD